MNLESICSQVVELSKKTGAYIREQHNKIAAELIEVKGKNDFVTSVDKSSEKILVIGLQKILPEAAFITEENTIAKEDKELKWIIDPRCELVIHRIQIHHLAETDYCCP